MHHQEISSIVPKYPFDLEFKTIMATPRDLVLLEQKYEVKPHSAVMYLSNFGSK